MGLMKKHVGKIDDGLICLGAGKSGVLDKPFFKVPRREQAFRRYSKYDTRQSPFEYCGLFPCAAF